ncbi:hypothetical protein ACG3JJ_01250 [Streptococcus parauberis]|uniref:hypothetical protein n=1 Tax=Streptococcus parauberis TaxID=1348 RepID=UPI0002E33CAF|nr:hypothetical protein [Streptococcus parauberis]QBX27455.1 hypothetical protein Javan386_0056 [Streptococcus phage Javan386]UWM90949.1 hypothetical protein N2A94_10750 [Streptococcus parauberis]
MEKLNDLNFRTPIAEKPNVTFIDTNDKNTVLLIRSIANENIYDKDMIDQKIMTLNQEIDKKFAEFKNELTKASISNWKYILSVIVALISSPFIVSFLSKLFNIKN